MNAFESKSSAPSQTSSWARPARGRTMRLLWKRTRRQHCDPKSGLLDDTSGLRITTAIFTVDNTGPLVRPVPLDFSGQSTIFRRGCGFSCLDFTIIDVGSGTGRMQWFRRAKTFPGRSFRYKCAGLFTCGLPRSERRSTLVLNTGARCARVAMSEFARPPGPYPAALQ